MSFLRRREEEEREREERRREREVAGYHGHVEGYQ